MSTSHMFNLIFIKFALNNAHYKISELESTHFIPEEQCGCVNVGQKTAYSSSVGRFGHSVHDLKLLINYY